MKIKTKITTNILKLFIGLITLIALSSYAYGYKGQPYAEALRIDAHSLSTRGWYDVFKTEKGMRKYGIWQLSPKQRSWLKRYLLDHASDSKIPSISGLYKKPETYSHEDLKK